MAPGPAMIEFRVTRFITRHVLYALIFGGLTGSGFILFLIEFDRYTRTEAFCASCHSMELVAAPYRQSRHYRPASGVRADCGDCHVSAGVFAATWDHLLGGKDLLKQLWGVDYDDPITHALHLPEAAFAARRWFKERNSATCQRCHVPEAIYGSRPDTLSIHAQEAEGKTCIDCHINLVHRSVPGERAYKRDQWQSMIEAEFHLAPGSTAALR